MESDYSKLLAAVTSIGDNAGVLLSDLLGQLGSLNVTQLLTSLAGGATPGDTATDGEMDGGPGACMQTLSPLHPKKVLELLIAPCGAATVGCVPSAARLLVFDACSCV